MRGKSPAESALVFHAFDLMHCDGVHLRDLALSERRRDLERLCRKAKVPFLRLVEQFPDGPTLFRYACEYGFVGIVSKKLALALLKRAEQSLVQISLPAMETRPRRAATPAPSEREKTPGRRRAELARLQECLGGPRMRRGLEAAVRAQVKAPEQEIAELEAV
jgi:hypothetical protein